MSNQAIVIIADVVGSSSLSPPERVAVQDAIQRWCGGQVGFKFSGGDEFEWRLPDAPGAMEELLLLRSRLGSDFESTPSVALRCGIGRGSILVDSPVTPYAEDGPAYHRARSALERLSPGWQRRIRVNGWPDRARYPGLWTLCDGGQPSPLLDALWLMMDSLMEAWSPAQWEAIRLLMMGNTQANIAATLAISPQAVSKRLHAAQLDLYLEGLLAMKKAWWGNA